MKSISNLNDAIKDFKGEEVPDGELRIEKCDECDCQRIKKIEHFTIKDALVHMLNATAQTKTKDVFVAEDVARKIFRCNIAGTNGDDPAGDFSALAGIVELENYEHALLKRVVTQNSFGNNGRYLPCVMVHLLRAIGVSPDHDGDDEDK